MYLSRLLLNPYNRRVQGEVAYPYEMHRTLMKAFPAHLESQAERVLFRVDRDGRNPWLTLLVQSHEMPDWSFLEQPAVRSYLFPCAEANPGVKPLALHLSDGRVLAFRLRANPTVKRNGKRWGLLRPEEQLDWLKRKGEDCGFCVLSVTASMESRVGGTIHRENEDHNLQLLAVRFDGLLQVTDPTALAENARQGIGSGKGFGFGLLSLAPLSLA